MNTFFFHLFDIYLHILYIDDQIPVPMRGAGYGRVVTNLRLLATEGMSPDASRFGVKRPLYELKMSPTVANVSESRQKF